MAEIRVRNVQAGQTKIRNVPIAVTPEGFWCCPSPAALQKTLKNHNPENKRPTLKTSIQKNPTHSSEKRSQPNSLKSRIASDNQRPLPSDTSALSPKRGPERTPKPNAINQQRKISVGFGQLETSDLKLVVSGKDGSSVRMSLHKSILAQHSSFFSDKLSKESLVSCIEVGDCDDVEIYVETLGLMYCNEVRQRLIKQSVPRVLRILKVAESLGFHACMKSCLEYLEAVPWVGEEEDHVVSSVRHLARDNFGVSPILKRVSPGISNPPNDTLAHILELVLKSSDDRGRREMKPLVLKLLRENRILISGSADICIETLYRSCQSCLDSLLILFKQASEPGFADKQFEKKDPVVRQIAVEVDNILWLLEILADRHIADEFAVMWAGQDELAGIHPRLPIVSRHPVSCITARLFVGVGRGEMLPSKDTRQQLLNIWLQPLIDDYSWLQHACRSFDRKVVEEGIGRTILTLPLEDQQSILLSWLGSFLKVGDNCPNLQSAFEVWWRRTFIRPFVEQQGNMLQADRN